MRAKGRNPLKHVEQCTKKPENADEEARRSCGRSRLVLDLLERDGLRELRARHAEVKKPARKTMSTRTSGGRQRKIAYLEKADEKSEKKAPSSLEYFSEYLRNAGSVVRAMSVRSCDAWKVNSGASAAAERVSTPYHHETLVGLVLKPVDRETQVRGAIN